MKAAMIQNLVTDDLQQNLAQTLDLLGQAAKAGADIAVLCELWNTPFINSTILKHAGDYQTIVPALQRAAKEHGMWIFAGTIPVEEEGNLYNRCLVFNDKGEIAAYADKLHLLEVHTAKSDYKEADVFTPGKKITSFDTPWGKAGILICYDTRFCEAARLLGQEVSFLIAPCGFNARTGEKHFRPLMQTRAMENEIFVIAVNPQKADYKTYSSWAHSVAVSPDGVILHEMAENEPLALVDIDTAEIEKVRARAPFWKLRRTDLYTLKKLPDPEQTERKGSRKI
jgi:predicted amidohydrolase